MPASDLHTYLSSLLVTDRQGLVFLYQTVVGEGEATMETMVGALAEHVTSSRRSLPGGLRHWLEQPTSLQRKLLARVIRLSGFYRDESSAGPLRQILGNKGLAAVHPAAVSALALALGAGAAPELGRMLWATPVAQWHVRETAILSELGGLGWASSVEDLIRALGVPYDSPVRAAATALTRFDADDVMPRLLQILDTATADGAGQRQLAGVALALGMMGDGRAVPSLRRMLPGAGGGAGPIAACAAAVALARMGDERALGPLAAFGKDDRGHEGAELRAASMQGIGFLMGAGHSMGGEVEGLLRRGLLDSQPEVRSAAAQALATAGDPAGAEALCQALGEENSPLVKIDMVQALGALAEPTSVGALVQVLRDGGVTTLRIEAMMALARFGDPALAMYLTPLQSHRDDEIAQAAGRALRRLLYRSFTWPKAEPPVQPSRVELHSLENARSLLIPNAVETQGFFEMVVSAAEEFFGTEAAAPDGPEPLGWLTVDAEKVEITQGEEVTGQILWAEPFAVQITREPIGSGAQEDIGIHFVLRQRQAGTAATFHRVACSLWCAPSDLVGTLQAKRESLPCLHPHQTVVFLSALRYFAEVHGERLPML